ncbi:MAG TPA: amidohydrolase, partial [Algoriphagus sp.]|nr:amidohydrolase [Algoriphagus sp.]
MRYNYLAITTAIFTLSLSNISFAQKKVKTNPLKEEVKASVDKRFDALTDLSDRIWSFEEIAFRETQSAKALAD